MQRAPESFTVDGVAVALQIAGSGVEGKGFDHLLRSPLGARECGDIEAHDLTSLMPEHKEHLEDSKGRRGHGEIIDRREVSGVVVKEGPPGQRRADDRRAGGAISRPDDGESPCGANASGCRA